MVAKHRNGGKSSVIVTTLLKSDNDDNEVAAKNVRNPFWNAL